MSLKWKGTIYFYSFTSDGCKLLIIAGVEITSLHKPLERPLEDVSLKEAIDGGEVTGQGLWRRHFAYSDSFQPSGEDICIHHIRTNQCLCWHPCCHAELNLDTHLLDDGGKDRNVELLVGYKLHRFRQSLVCIGGNTKNTWTEEVAVVSSTKQNQFFNLTCLPLVDMPKKCINTEAPTVVLLGYEFPAHCYLKCLSFPSEDNTCYCPIW